MTRSLALLLICASAAQAGESAEAGQKFTEGKTSVHFVDRSGKKPVRMSMKDFMKHPDKVDSLRRAVQKMRGLSYDNPFSWVFQANIHDRPAWPDFVCKAGLAPNASVDVKVFAEKKDFQPKHNVFAGCPHHNWWFFVWHRAYLYYFERILQWAAHDDGLAMPYWNYYDDDQRQMPLIFREPNLPSGLRNPLYLPSSVNIADARGVITRVRMRNPFYNDQGGALGDDVVSFGPANDALQSRLFYLDGLSGLAFGGVVSANLKDAPGTGLIEKTPHDQIHNALGGPADPAANDWNMGFMSAIEHAARDPIFWPHHANVDRIWAMWEKLGGKNPSNMANPADADWLNAVFKFYDVQDGRPIPVTITAREFLRMELGYVYDNLEPPNGVPRNEVKVPLLARLKVPGPAPTVVASTPDGKKIDLTSVKPMTVPLAAAKNMAPKGLGEIAAAPTNDATSFILELTGVKKGKRIPAELFYDMYLDLPKDVNDKDKAKFFVERLTFFALDHQAGHGAMGDGGATYRFSVTKIMARSRFEDRTASAIVSVTFVPRYGAEGAPRDNNQGESPLTIGQVSLIYRP